VTKRYKQTPPVPFNITSLQTEAYRLFGYSPQQTMSIAQKLYTSAYISYPRTSSEKLPPQIGYRDILLALSHIKKYEKLCKTLLALPSLKPTEGKRTDPAHEAIHPTVEPPKRELSGPFAKIYDLICRRYMTHFATDAMRESMQILLDVAGHKFSTTGRRTIEKGWMEFYGPYAKFDEIILPELKKGDKLSAKKLDMLSKQTSPPPRWSQAAIIKEMEKRELGTRATRASILQTLYDRSYITDKTIRVTELGMTIVKVLKKYVPDLVDEKLTRKFEKEIEKISSQKIKKEKIFNQAKKALVKISDEFRSHEDAIGKELGKAVVATQEDKSTLGACIVCKDGTLKVLFSPWTKKSFVGCSNYNRCIKCGFTKKACKCKCPICGGEKGKCKCEWKAKIWTPKCATGYPLPFGASIQRLDKTCDKCKTPMIQVIRKGKRPFRMCLDPKCETKADWGKPRGKKGAKKALKKKK
jgi:DNA topoisomerase-1